MATVQYTEPTISYSEATRPQSPQESHDGERFTATRILECAWADRLTLMDQLRRAYEVTLDSGRKFIYGDVYPHRSRCYVTGVNRIEGYGSPGQGANTKISKWKTARLHVRYEELPFNPEGGSGSSTEPEQLYAEELEFTTERIVLPAAAKIFWADGTEIADVDAPGFTDHYMRWSLQFTERGSLPAAIKDAVGKCNQSAVTSITLGMTFAAETLLYEGARVRRAVFSDGTATNEVALNYLFKRTEWNKFWRPGNDTPQPIYTDTGGTTQLKPAEPTDFASAFDI